MNLTYGELRETPIGPISFMAGDSGLQRVAFKPLDQLKAVPGISQTTPSLKGLEIVGALISEINEYLFGIRKTFSVEIDWQAMDEFQRKVLALTVEIPYGSTMT